jgi:phosphohistidine phosphatase
MKRLLLLRHAKAEQDPGDGDHARALSERGRGDAMLIGHYMDTHAYWPGAVLCSTSKRTVETWDLIARELARVPESKFLKSLYLASPKQILNAAHGVGEDASVTLMIGHNPGMEDVAARLARKPASRDEEERREKMAGKFPTCALAVVDFDVGAWRDITAGTGLLADFVRPRDLKD